jgi:ketosteroid isomerase-like protein
MTPEVEIKALLDAMFAAWNGEDQPRYLQHYWRSEDMRWSMKGEFYKGWASMEREYDRDYPPGAMGIVKIWDVEVQVLAADVVVAMYPWTHTLPTQAIAGCTTQIFRRIGGAWLIVHEISARAPGS